jgi:VanZ family protein
MSAIRQGTLKWGPVVLWMGMIFILSAQPTLPSAENQLLDLILKQSAHVLVYAGLAVLWLRALQDSHLPASQRLCIALVAAGLYALSDEFHQRFVPGRTASLVDVGCDWLGAGLAAWLWQRGPLAALVHRTLPALAGREKLARPNGETHDPRKGNPT